MSPARYLFRMDDIHPRMDWSKFGAIMTIFNRKRVRPLLAVIPDNKDSRLDIENARPDFWETMRRLQHEGAVEFAQHGYQHILKPRPGAALFGSEYRPRDDLTEFAGDPLEDQLERISMGQRILLNENIRPKYWVSPNHTLDSNTLEALTRLGFTAVSDSFALRPYKRGELIFVPQQFWRPRWMPFGVITICLHSSTMKSAAIREVAEFVEGPHVLTDFSAEVHHVQPSNTWADTSFRNLYVGIRGLRRLFLPQT